MSKEILKQININSNVYVKLNDRGKRIYHEMVSKTLKEFSGLKYPELKTDENGYSKWQLWYLMEFFGPYISIGFDTCFETTILINEKDIEEFSSISTTNKDDENGKDCLHKQ